MLEMRDVMLTFGQRKVLDKIDLELRAAERIGLIGPSGAGKSSLLRLACGLQKPTSGLVRNGFERPAMLFQEPRLLPWRSVGENIVLPLLALGLARVEAEARSLEWLHQVELSPDLAKAWPRELSGGMAQRVALARALSTQPDLLLLDEPFSALDPALRERMSQLCTHSIQATGAALLCVSHLPDELALMVDRCLLVQGAQLFSQPSTSPTCGTP